MATVYLAEDLRHHRKVALKVLRPEIAATLGAERFHREIQIAAQLQHPNILPVHDSGEAAGFLYYVMPFVEGHSLRERLAKETELPVPEAARILRDVADALSAAHAKGVVHRDIKPENVLLTGRHALVADFGVAKAVSEATGRQTLTTAGVALGTPAYMAPEQAAASPHMDHRADIYAFGVMAYEMLTGRPPFTAPEPQAVLSAHVTEAPVEVTQHRATIPQSLAQLIMRCLEKKAADRPQTADELLPVLDSLATPSGGITPTQTQPVAATRSRRRIAVAKAVGTVAAFVAVGVVLGQLLRSRALSVSVSDLTQVTNAPGVEFEPAISPDGNEVAYAAGPMGSTHIAVRSTAAAAGAGEVRLSDSSFGMAFIPAWSSDGSLVRFGGCRTDGCRWYETGRLGGAVRPSAGSMPPATFAAWSPDGASVAYFVRETLFVAPVAATAAPRRIAVHPGPVWGPHSLVWSPDGRLIAYVNGNTYWQFSGNVAGSAIWVVSAAGGAPQQITSQEHMNVSPVWLDGRHLLFVSNRDGARGVYVVTVGSRGAAGVPRIVPGVADPHSISYSVASQRLAWSKFTVRQNIWSYPLGRTSPVSVRDGIRVTTGNEVSEVADASADGKWLAFDSNIRGRMDLYKMLLPGGEAVRLTDSPRDGWNPRWSPDGTEIAYYADAGLPGGAWTSIMVMPAAGGAPVTLTNAPGINDFPSWSPDGLHIVFLSYRAKRGQAWVLSRDSVRGTWHPDVLLADSANPQDWAPDGSGVLCQRSGSLLLISPQKQVLWRRDVAATTRLVDWSGMKYSKDGRTLYTVGTHRDGRAGIWAIPVSGGEANLVVRFDDRALVTPSVSTLGVGRERLYLALSEYESDIWVAKLK